MLCSILTRRQIYSQLTSPSEDIDLNNSKNLLCSLAFDGGGLDAAIEMLNEKEKSKGGRGGDGGDDDENDEENDGDEVR